MDDLFYPPAKIKRAAARLATVLLPFILTGCLELETVLPPTPVDGNESVFATPLAVGDGAVYTANVEPAENKTGLKTVVRRIERDRQGNWRAQSTVVEQNTVRDPYHNQASIALDRRGYVHLTYDMHNVPWQYSVSEQPRSIDRFVFRGQRTSQKKLEEATTKSIHDFPGLGDAAIPGNQVTYPAFFTDRRGDLYVTYRYAVRPKRTYFERIYAGGIARYNPDKGTWRQIGREVNLSGEDVQLGSNAQSAVTRPFAMQPDWWVYQIRLAFDRNNGMHASWLWRYGNAGGDGTNLSYAYSPDGSERFYRSNGQAYELPIGLKEAERVVRPEQRANSRRPIAPDGFYNPASMRVTLSGTPRISIQPIGKTRRSFLRERNGNWKAPETAPYSAPQILYDDNGYEWAFATGLTVLRRDVDADGQPRSDWDLVFEGGDLCQPKVVPAPEEGAFYIHANVLQGERCRRDRITVVRLSGIGS